MNNQPVNVDRDPGVGEAPADGFLLARPGVARVGAATEASFVPGFIDALDRRRPRERVGVLRLAMGV
jgi:hypothetical protein